MEDTDCLQHLAKRKDSLDIREHSWKASIIKFAAGEKLSLHKS